MDRGRRAVLAALAGAGIGTAGCLGSAEEATPESADLETTGADDEAQSQSQTQETTESDSERPEHLDELAAETEQILDELEWFAAEFPAIRQSFVDTGEEIIEVIAEVGETITLSEQTVRRLDRGVDRPALDEGWPFDIDVRTTREIWRYVPIDWQRPVEGPPEERPLDPAEIDRLRESAATLATSFEAFEPQFLGARKIRRFTEETIDEIAQYNRIEDTAMVVAGLVQLIDRYRTITGPEYVDEHLSGNPIQNRLAEFMAADDFRTLDAPPLFEVEYRGRRSHTAFVYPDAVGGEREAELFRAEPMRTIDGSSWVPDGTRLQDVVEPVSVRADRRDSSYVIVHAWESIAGDDPGYFAEDLPSGTVFLQRYQTTAAASRALEEVFRPPRHVRLDPVDPVGFGPSDSPWQPFSFRFDGEPWYAALRQVGRLVFVAGVSRRPFDGRAGGRRGHRDERTLGVDWQRPFEGSWLWQE